MYKVRKRTGKLIEFDLAKISNAITLAFDACEKQYNQNIIDFLALKVTANFEPKIKNGAIAVEDIQDSVERRKRLARKRKLHGHLFRRRTYSLELRRDHRKLLAFRSV